MDLGGSTVYVTTRHYSGIDRSSLNEIARRREEIETFVKGGRGSALGMRSLMVTA